MYPDDGPESPRVLVLLGKTDALRKQAGLQLLEENREHRLVAANIPLDMESITALLDTTPEILETILDTVLERLRIEKVMVQ